MNKQGGAILWVIIWGVILLGGMIAIPALIDDFKQTKVLFYDQLNGLSEIDKLNDEEGK